MKKFVLALFCLGVGSLAFGLDVKTMATDQPPKFVMKDGVFSGFGIDVLRGLEKIDPQLHFVFPSKTFTPIARVVKGLEDGEIDVYVGFLKNPERVAKFDFALPLFQTYNVFVAASGETAVFKTLEEFKAVNKDAAVLGISNSAQVLMLKAAGFKVDDGSASFGVAFDKLVAGRGRFLFIPDLAANAFIKEHGLRTKVKVFAPVTAPEEQYFCFSKKATPAVVDAVTAALTKLKSSGALAAIIAPYLTN